MNIIPFPEEFFNSFTVTLFVPSELTTASTAASNVSYFVPFTSAAYLSSTDGPEGVFVLPPPLGLLVELSVTFPFGAVISTLPVTVPSTFISTFLSVFIIISSVIVAFGFNTILSLAFAFSKASFNSSTVPTS